ncbi:MAG: CCA tRNA nucleotidyltransferase [Oscillospiraceae bacterium]|nr:CCA tRNA nucleotidyltransferase [Oscillospiraceae bacterium]
MDIYIPENVLNIMKCLEKGGFEAYTAGGCVRDAILGKEPKDYDIATSASPDEIKRCLEGYNVIDTGIKHGTVTVISDDDYVEVTTFRIDGNYSDHRRPDSVKFSRSLDDDLSRRDFTINAMAYNPEKGLIDKFGGQKDLFRQKIRCVGEPAVRFNEDALRIIRALRFASVLNFEIDSVTSLAIHDMKYLLTNVSMERISKEIDMLITGKSPADILTDYSDVMSVIIPEVRPCIGFDQHSRYHVYDVWQHTAMAVEHSKCDRDVRLALLLHDIAKPSCCTIDDEGNGHFPGHEQVGAHMAEDILHRMHYPNETVNCISELIKYHYVTPVDDAVVVKRLLSVIGIQNFFKLTEVMKGDSRAKQSLCFERVQTLEAMERKAEQIIANKECISISQLNVNGTDITALGAEGKQIGDILENLLSLVIDSRVGNVRAELLKCAKAMID